MELTTWHFVAMELGLLACLAIVIWKWIRLHRKPRQEPPLRAKPDWMNEWKAPPQETGHES